VKRVSASILEENSQIFPDICSEILLISLDIPATLTQASTISFDKYGVWDSL